MPPSLDDLLRRGQDRMRDWIPSGGGGRNWRLMALVPVVLVAGWLASGFYRVQPDEQGVVLRFGAWVRTTEPGLNYHLPSPIETVLTPSVTRENRIDVGFRSVEGRNSSSRDLADESLMLTGDENIVDIEFWVLWRIKDAGQFLFGTREPEALVKMVAESAMREVVGRTEIQQAFTEGRGRIEADTRAVLQSLLDGYGAGVEIRQVQLRRVDPPQPVVDAFNEVQRARADRERLRNEAEAYRNDVIPRARGDSEKMLQDAQGYREASIAQAIGDSRRFLSVLEAYRVNPDVTRERLYLETMERVLKSGPKTVLGTRGADGAAGAVQPYMLLPSPPAPARPPASSGPAAAPSSSNSSAMPASGATQ